MSLTGKKTNPILAGTLASTGPWASLFARAGFKVYPYQLGAMVRTTSTGTAVQTYGLGQFTAGDYVIFCTATAYGSSNLFIPSTSKIRRITNVSTSDDAITIDSAVSITAGDYILDIGVDTASTPESGPNYDGSTITLYNDNAGVTASSLHYVQTSTGGTFIGWVGPETRAVDLLITNSSGVPQIVNPFFSTLPTHEVNGVQTLTNGGSTPAVGGFGTLKLGQSGGATSVLNFTGAVAGQGLNLIATDGNTTLVHNPSVLYLSTGANITMTANQVLQFVYDGTIWRQIGSSSAASSTISAMTEVILASSTLVGTAANIDLTSIDQTYDHLKLRLLARSDRAAQAEEGVNIKLNNDGTTSNYRLVQFQDDGASATVAASADVFIGNIPAATATTDYFGSIEIDIPYYTGARMKNIFIRSFERNASTAQKLELNAIQWANTAAVSRLTLTPRNATNFIAGTRYVLTGVGAKTLVTG